MLNEDITHCGKEVVGVDQCTVRQGREASDARAIGLATELTYGREGVVDYYTLRQLVGVVRSVAAHQSQD